MDAFSALEYVFSFCFGVEVPGIRIPDLRGGLYEWNWTDSCCWFVLQSTTRTTLTKEVGTMEFRM